VTTYYVSPDGNDANNGLGPDASHGTNKPFLTVGKTMNTGSPVLPGDTVYIAPGYYYSEALIPLNTISSVGSPTQWVGDPQNKQGFKTAAGVLLSPGLPWITTRTAAEGIDGAIASAANLVVMSTNGPSGMTFQYLVLEANPINANIFFMPLATSTDIIVTDCRLSALAAFASSVATNVPTAGRNWTFRRNVMFVKNVVGNFGISVAAATADADLTILIEENLIWGTPAGNALALSAAGGNIAGGIRIYDNTVVGLGNGNNTILLTTASRVSTVTPITLTGNLIVATCVNLNAGTSGQIIDGGYNRYLNHGNNANVNVSAAGTSKFYNAPNVVLPDLVTWGLEMPRADFLGWTDAAHANQKFSASGIVTADFRGRTIRPWGAGSSIGCWQAQSVAQDTGSAIAGGGANSLKITGAGEVSLYVPVDAAATTISVRTKSTTYGGASYPQLIVVANPSIGVTADQTVTASDANEATITSPSFTPTAAGVVEVRLVSRSTDVTSSTYFDLLTSP